MDIDFLSASDTFSLHLLRNLCLILSSQMLDLAAGDNEEEEEDSETEEDEEDDGEVDLDMEEDNSAAEDSTSEGEEEENEEEDADMHYPHMEVMNEDSNSMDVGRMLEQ